MCTACPASILRRCVDAALYPDADSAGLFYGMQTLRQYFEMPQHPAPEITDWPELAMRSDYLDMRGIFPKFENLLKLVEQMARYKLNTLVIEYEDKLPRARAEFCHLTQALTSEQHAQLLETARGNLIDVIPRQQSFGHLEYALKLPEYEHLREVPGTPYFSVRQIGYRGRSSWR